LFDDEVRRFDQRLVCPRCDISYPTPEPRLFQFTDPLGACPTCRGIGLAAKSDRPCAICHGSRYGEQALSVRIEGRTIAEVCAWRIDEVARFVDSLATETQTRAQLRKRVAHLQDMELGYLTLDRAAATLSVGEARHVRLAAALAATLAQALYVFEEPAAALHA